MNPNLNRQLNTGSTLIEVLVSMFILALGLLALVSMQARTSAGVKEAENMTLISQAAQNMAEKMAVAPKFSASGVDYSDYKIEAGDCANKTGSHSFKKADGTDPKKISEYATVVKNAFCADMNKISSVASGFSAIADTSGAQPVLEIQWNTKKIGNAPEPADKEFSYSVAIGG